MLCYDVHQEPKGCRQDIPQGSGWRYCPLCGRSTAHIVKPEDQEAAFTLSYDKAETRQMPLRNVGETALTVSVELEPGVLGIRLGAGQSSNIMVNRNGRGNIQIDVPPLTQAGALGYLLVSAKDVLRLPDEDPWQPRRTQEYRIPLKAEVEAPARVELAQDLAMFRESVSSREIVLHNRGKQPASITAIRYPSGYRVSKLNGVIPGEEEFRLTVTREWAEPAEERSELIIVTPDASPYEVLLYCPPPMPSEELPSAIIGIDFGTAFTSVAFRECRYHDEPDTVKFLAPPGEEDANRFPTRLWAGKKGGWAFASQATKRYKEAPDAGYMFREIKTLLRRSEEIHVHPEGKEDEAVAALRDKFGADWQHRLVIEYLSWLYRDLIVPELRAFFQTENVTVRYVFSLPVLDFASPNQTQYKEQMNHMEACIQAAGFRKGSYEFQFEPVCAALGLLFPPVRADWPRLGDRDHPIRTNNALMVFDSGGGTTDVVLARADVDQGDGKITLNVRTCLGVDSQTKEFGGEEVTTGVLAALKNPNSVTDVQNWAEVPVGAAMSLDLLDALRNEDGTDNDLDLRDRGTKLKEDLAQAGGEGVKRKNVTLSRKLLVGLVTKPLRYLDEEMQERIFTDVRPEDVNYYMCVGGNTYLQAVDRWVEMKMGDRAAEHSNRRLRLPDVYRKLAIAYGAAWVPDARLRNAVPYDLEIKVGNHPKPLLELQRNSSQEVYAKMSVYSMNPRERLVFKLCALLDERPYLLENVTLENMEARQRTLKVWGDVQNGKVRVQYQFQSPQAPPPEVLLEYAL